MKVLQINSAYGFASTGRSMMEFDGYLRDNNVESFLAASDIKNDSEGRVFKVSSAFDRKVHAFLSRITGLNGYYSRFVTFRLIRYIKRIVPDIIQIHVIHSNNINIPVLLRFLAAQDIRVVFCLHDCWWYTGKCCHYTCVRCYKWQGCCGRCPQLKKWIPSWFFDFTAKMQEDKINLVTSIKHYAVVGVSEWVTNECAKSEIGKKATLIQTVYNWIDTEKFSPQTSNYTHIARNKFSKRVILGVATYWDNRKGLDSFFALADRLPADTCIVLVGKVVSELKNCPDTVFCVGATDSVEELAEYYNIADVFVTYSLEETFGKVSAEALSCGTPVVCWNSTANAEIAGEECGHVVPLGEDMLPAILDVLDKGKSYYLTKCRQRATKLFGMEKNMNDLLHIYKKLIEHE